MQVRVWPGMRFGFPSELSLAFAAIRCKLVCESLGCARALMPVAFRKLSLRRLTAAVANRSLSGLSLLARNFRVYELHPKQLIVNEFQECLSLVHAHS